MRKIVLFCSDAYTSLGIIRCIGEIGKKIEVYCFGEFCEYLLASKYVSVGKSFKSKEQALQFLLKDYPTHEEKPILLTIPDPPAYLVDLHKDELEKKFIVMNAGKSGNVIHWMSKLNIAELAKKYGLTLPWTIVINKDERIPDDLEYPVFTKSENSTEGGKGCEGIFWNKSELEEKCQSVKTDRLIVMQYIQKVKEVNCFGISLDGHVYLDYYDERMRFTIDKYGHYNTFKRLSDSALQSMGGGKTESIKSMILETGYNGLFDVEFIQGKDGRLYFMEVNFRCDGELYKLVPGLNYPSEWCRLIEMKEAGLSLPDKLDLGKERFTGINETSDFRENVLTGKVNIFTWLYQFLKADKRMLVNLKDPLPFFVKVSTRLKKKLNHNK